MTNDGNSPWRVPLNSLGNTLSEARELAAVLEETLGVRVDYGTVIPRSATTTQPRGHSFKDRLRSGTPIFIDDRSINWSLLRYVISTESLKAGETSAGGHPGHVQVEVNSGGRVFFCFFAPSELGQPEGVAVLKFGPNRLLMQAEQFANELTRHLDICAPDCRIVRQAGASSEEWRAMCDACSRLRHPVGPHPPGNTPPASGGAPPGDPAAPPPTPVTAGATVTQPGTAPGAAPPVTPPGGTGGAAAGAAELAAELASLPVVLLMEYCPGDPLLECSEAFMDPGPQLATLEELGRLFLLDAVLGNADRLPCSDLCWRGNPNNILYGRYGSRCASHLVAIDSCVQRRPPAARLSAEDAGVDRLAQLLLTDQDVTLDLLRSSVLAQSPPGLAALAAAPGAAAEAFQRGFRECLGRVERIKGLLEMMHSKMHDWSMEFIKDIKALRPELPIPTPAVSVAMGGAGAAAGAAGLAGRLVAHYGNLGIRVGPGSGGGGSGGGAPSGTRGRVAAGGGGSGVGSPARPRQSPYLASSAKSVSRTRNASLGGVASVTAGAGPSKSPPPPRDVAAVAAAAAAAGSSPAGAAGSDGGLGVGSVGGAPPTDGDGELWREGCDPQGAPGSGPLPEAAAAAAAASGGGAGARGPARGSPVLGSRGGSSSSRQVPKLTRRGSGLLAAATGALGALPDWLARSPYLTSGPGQNNSSGRAAAASNGSGGLSSMSSRWKSATSFAALSRSNSSRSNSHSHSSGSHGSGASGAAGAPAAAPAGGAAGSRPVAAAASSTPQSRLSKAPPGRTSSGPASPRGSSAAVPIISTMRLPRVARSSSPSGCIPGDGSVQPPARRLSDLGAGAAAAAAAAAAAVASVGPKIQRGLRSAFAVPGVFGAGSAAGAKATPASPRHQAGRPGGADRAPPGGLSVGNSPSHQMSLNLRIRSVAYGNGGEATPGGRGGGGPLTPTLRHSRSFGFLRGSPRKAYLSPATPKFRSPVLDPALTSSPPEAGAGAPPPPPEAGDGYPAVGPFGRVPEDDAGLLLHRPSSPLHVPNLGNASESTAGLSQLTAATSSPTAPGLAPGAAGSPPDPMLHAHGTSSLRNPGPPDPFQHHLHHLGEPLHPHPHPPLQLHAQPHPSAGCKLATWPHGSGGLGTSGGPGTSGPSWTGSSGGSLASGAKPPLPRAGMLRSGPSVSGSSPYPATEPHPPSHLQPHPHKPHSSHLQALQPGTQSGAGPHAVSHTHPHSGHVAQHSPLQQQQGDGELFSRASFSSPLSPGLTVPSITSAATSSHTHATPSTDLDPATPPFAFRPAASSSTLLNTPPSHARGQGTPTPPTATSASRSSRRSPSPSTASRKATNGSTSASATTTPYTPYGGGGASATTAGSTATPASGLSVRSTGGGGGGSRRTGASGSVGRATGGGAGVRAYGAAGTRGTPGSSRAVVMRASPNHASPYEQVRSDMSLTLALKSITVEARKDDLLSSRVAHWKELFRSRGEELKRAVGEWQSRHQLERVLTTGFLDGTHPIVDTYELKVRLEHMLRRLQVLQEAAAAQKPSRVLEPPAGLFLGGAVCADSHHILRHLGVTHIVNATEELLLPPPTTGFMVLRVALRDVDDEDIAAHFEEVSEFIKSCHASGGSVLVHCSEGKSRSVTLVLAYLMRVRGWRLKDAFDHVKARRSVACPNAGFMARLLSYERDLYGDNSYIPQQLKKAKPEPVTCPVCGAAVGISSASLGVHMKRAHPAQNPTSAITAPTGSAPAATTTLQNHHHHQQRFPASPPPPLPAPPPAVAAAAAGEGAVESPSNEVPPAADEAVEADAAETAMGSSASAVDSPAAEECVAA